MLFYYELTVLNERNSVYFDEVRSVCWAGIGEWGFFLSHPSIYYSSTLCGGENKSSARGSNCFRFIMIMVYVAT
jgi:hypothetical protein